MTLKYGNIYLMSYYKADMVHMVSYHMVSSFLPQRKSNIIKVYWHKTAFWAI